MTQSYVLSHCTSFISVLKNRQISLWKCDFMNFGRHIEFLAAILNLRQNFRVAQDSRSVVMARYPRRPDAAVAIIGLYVLDKHNQKCHI